MLLTAGLCLTLLTTSATPQAWVVLSRRSGVAVPKALQAAKDVSARLSSAGIPLVEVEDVTTCKGKKVCLLELARKKQVPVLVTVELGAAMDDGTLRIEALSVDEDGKQLALVELDGPVGNLVPRSYPRLDGNLVPAVRNALGLNAPEPVVVAKPEPKPEPEPVKPAPVVELVPPPMPPSVEAPAPSKPFFTTPRVIGTILGGAGVAGGVVAGIFGAQAGSAASRYTALCPSQPCTSAEGFEQYKVASQGQTTAIIAGSIGGAALIAGVLLIAINPGGDAAAEPTTTPAVSAIVVPIQGGAVGSFSLRF